MKTPQLFSASIVESLLPETLGQKYQPMAMKLAEKTGHRCEVSGYPYPPMDKVQGQNAATTPLMIEPRDKDSDGQPLSAKAISDRVRKHGINLQTVRMVCPLVFWSRHVDLAVRYGRGSLIFAPWISQGELVTLFRTLSVAKGQPERHQSIPTLGMASQVMEEIESNMGNEAILVEVLALPENTEWDADVWLQTMKTLPARDRRVYQERFAKHLRFWPSPTAFHTLNGYWATTAHAVEEDPKHDIGCPWIRRFTPAYEKALQQLATPSEKKLATDGA
ncbi:hypothetical protein AWH63_10310 [Marinobacter sp. C18]|uniref:hypothetical protein n=1 Tax=Marinobacter sp. C18 TaxID=1772288 RepID=UPI000948A86A|nr:hypothetical protein [Marinobacter sp. C18]OLF81925.1 hypothetical protein AWH63_10310 [Marinobacter sp. C18]